MYALFLRFCAIALFLMCTLPGDAGAEVFRWTDAAGKVHFSDKKPDESERGHVETFDGRGAVSFIDAPPATASLPKLRMFTTQWCPVCKKAKAWLKQRGTPFEEFDIETSAAAKAEYRRAGGRGVPLILLGKERMAGFDARRLEIILAKAGY